mgnify:CR=1 FL=1
MGAAMVDVDPKDLAKKEPHELATWLIEQAREVRAMVLSEDFSAMRQLLTTLSRAASAAQGVQRDLLEVAESFLRPLGSSHLGTRDLALRAFLREQGADGEGFLRVLLERGGILKSSYETFPEGLRAAAKPLFSSGALLELEGRYVLAAGANGIVRDLIEPPVFRMWAAVERARSAAEGRPPIQAAQLLAAQTGVLTDDAQRFLKAHPLQPRLSPRGTTAPAELSHWDVAGQGKPPAQKDVALRLEDESPRSQSLLDDVELIPRPGRTPLEH